MLNKLQKREKVNVRSGFVHIPASHELGVYNKRLPSWSHEDLVKAVKTMIEVLDV